MKHKTLLSLTISSILLVAANSPIIASEAGNDHRQGDRNAAGHFAALVNRVFNYLDTDESGGISLREYFAPASAKAAKRFNRLDTDDDRLISLEEFLAAVNHHDGDDEEDESDREAIRQCVAERMERDAPDRMTAEERFNAMDTNDDGFIDYEEFTAGKKAAAEAKFNRIDTNMDGEISKRELAVALKHRRAQHRAIKECRDQQDLVNSI